MQHGQVHVYFGEGKGKTSAAMGLALRAHGAGKRAVILQFLKGQSTSELAPLQQLGITVLRAQTSEAFVFQMSAEQRAQTRRDNDAALQKARALGADVLVLDEACAALSLGVLDEALLRAVVCEKPPLQELVLTGRDPAPWLVEAAQYATEMRCVRHPCDEGLAARKGIEF